MLLITNVNFYASAKLGCTFFTLDDGETGGIERVYGKTALFLIMCLINQYLLL